MKTLTTILLIMTCFGASHTFAQKKMTQPVSPKNTLDHWQILLGQARQNMKTKEVDPAGGQSSSEKEMIGTNFGLYVGFVKNVNEYFGWQGQIGYETFSVSNSATTCPTNSAAHCSVEVGYLSLGLMPRLSVVYEKIQVWSGVGLSLKQPISKKATAILPNEIQTTSSYGIAVGLDAFVNANWIIPLEIEQQFFLQSETVEARQLLVKIGLGQAF